jgi:hypothetical protein
MYARGAHILLFNVVTVLDMVSRAAPVFDRRKKRLLPSCVASISRLNRPRRLAWPRTSPFHGGNTGSNPVGDANLPKDLRETAFSNQGPFGSNKLLDCRRDWFRFGAVRHDQLWQLLLERPLHWRNRLCVGVCCDFEGCVAQQLLDGLEVFAIRDNGNSHRQALAVSRIGAE